MSISKICALGVLTALCAPRLALADTITWSQVTRLSTASKIAVCGGDRLYYVDKDGWLWADMSPTTRGSATARSPIWQRLSHLSMSVLTLSCAAGRLYLLSSDKTLYRNDGDDLHLRWQSVSRIPWATQVIAVTFGGGAVLYALSTDGVLMVSERGAENTWLKHGKTPSAERISAPSLLDVFRLDAKGRLYVNHGNGFESYWHSVDAPAGAVEIASAKAGTLYALANGSLWQGTVRHEVRSVRIESNVFNGRSRLLLGQTRITVREVCLTQQGGNPRLLSEGRIPRPGGFQCTIHVLIAFTPPPAFQQYGLHPGSVEIVGPRSDTVARFTEFSSSNLGASLGQDRIPLSATFTTATFTPNTGIGPISIGVVGLGVSGELVPTKDSFGETVLSLANFQFLGELQEPTVPSAPALFLVFKSALTRGVGPQLADSVATASVQTALRQVLLQLANQFTDETWQGIAYGGILIEGGALQFRVER
jgi:hypothetical protein